MTLEPWTDPHGIWKSKADFFQWVRGQLRRSWTRYPIKNSFKNLHSRPNLGELPKQVKSIVDCARCGKPTAKSKSEVDHVIGAGRISDWKDVEGFIQRLFTTSDNLRILCKPCHKIITLSERFQCSEDEVRFRVLIASFRKLNALQQRDLLNRHGADLLPLTTTAKRVAAYSSIIRKGGCPDEG